MRNAIDVGYIVGNLNQHNIILFSMVLCKKRVQHNTVNTVRVIKPNTYKFTYKPICTWAKKFYLMQNLFFWK